MGMMRATHNAPPMWLFVVFFLSVVAAIIIPRWRERRSRDWPRTPASLADFYIAPGGRVSVLECTFSYRVNGRQYVGHYKRNGSKSELADFAASLKQGPLCTRYNASHPEEHFLNPYDQMPAASDE